jgi:hypothetical protein
VVVFGGVIVPEELVTAGVEGIIWAHGYQKEISE